MSGRTASRSINLEQGSAMLCTLAFSFSDHDVHQINTALGQQITVVKSDAGSIDAVTVAWISFPAANTITVTWSEDYYIYETTSDLTNGAKIVEGSFTGIVTTKEIYTYSGGVFTSGVGGESEAFDGVNAGPSDAVFGLAQAAKVGGVDVSAPISAITVGPGETVSFKPRVTLSVFLSGSKDNGTVLSKVAGGALTFSLDLSNPSANLTFNSQNSTFNQSTGTEFSEMLMHHGRKRHPHQK